MISISLKMVEVVIFSVAQLVTTVVSFSRNSTQKMRSYYIFLSKENDNYDLPKEKIAKKHV